MFLGGIFIVLLYILHLCNINVNILIFVDKLKLSVDGVDVENGFSTYYSKEASVDKAMLDCSDVCIIAADRTKLYRNAFVKIADINSANYIVTTGSFADEDKELLQEKGVNIIVAE